MKIKTNTLDYEIVNYDDEFRVWTPDTSGAVIGFGKTREEAIRSAIAHLGTTTVFLVEELSGGDTNGKTTTAPGQSASP